jgi:hypothetical protein
MKNTFIIIAIFALVACSKDDEKVETNGEAIISSQLFSDDVNYYTEGFSFEKAKNVRYSITSTTNADLVLTSDVSSSGKIESLVLLSAKNNEAFFKAGEFEDLAEAEAFYNSITDAGSNTYTPTAEDIALYQVYIYQSPAKKYAKFLVKDLKVVPDSPKSHVEITIEWLYQPNGEKVFLTEE